MPEAAVDVESSEALLVERMAKNRRPRCASMPGVTKSRETARSRRGKRMSCGARWRRRVMAHHDALPSSRPLKVRRPERSNTKLTLPSPLRAGDEPMPRLNRRWWDVSLRRGMVEHGLSLPAKASARNARSSAATKTLDRSRSPSAWPPAPGWHGIAASGMRRGPSLRTFDRRRRPPRSLAPIPERALLASRIDAGRRPRRNGGDGW